MTYLKKLILLGTIICHSLEYFFGNENLEYLIEKRNIEIVPLAYMRGRTLNNACIILDEAQNATSGQIKMFLTRLERILK